VILDDSFGDLGFGLKGEYIQIPTITIWGLGFGFE